MVTTLLLCSLLCLGSLLIPGYVRPGGTYAAFLTVTVLMICVTIVMSLLREQPPVVYAVMVYGSDAAAVTALTSLSDSQGARVGSLLLVLPTIFSAIFLSLTSLLVQTLLMVLGNTVLMWSGGDRGPVLALHLAFAVISSLVPAASIRLVQGQRNAALRRERQAAVTDPLTGLVNRRGLTERIERLLAAAEDAAPPFGLLLVDLDRFREVNDTLGHVSGDRLLSEIGSRLSGALSEVDTIARLGGDEFAVLLPAVGDLDTAVATAGDLHDALARPFLLDGVEVDVEVSIGVVVSGAHGTDATLLMRRADIAVYVAKERHVGILGYSPEIDGYSPERLALLGQLRRALDRRELVLHYQPKVSLDTGEVVGVEALVRWCHPERGLVPPDEFIPLAENTGLIGPLTRYVLDAALAQADAFATAGCPVPVAVNLSPRNLTEQELCPQIAALLDKHGVPADRLELEITESTVMTEPLRARRLLTELNELGIRTAMDDFGAGHTSLAQLRTLPMSQLKIDRSFVITMDTNPENALIIRSMIDLGHSLGFTVVAEGVETQRSMTTLSSYGCDIAQGYHFSRPLPPEAFLDWFSSRTRTATATASASASA